MSHVPYASAVGSIMYAMVCTRPDLSQAVSMVLRYMHDPDKGHWEAVRWILRYIKGTIDVGLVFMKDVASKQECTDYVGSDYAGDLDKHPGVKFNHCKTCSESFRLLELDGAHVNELRKA